ncbi:MAG: DMT family transporter [Longimicrobiales bacterium]|nr:DMT family transporter [Longimicrobiales bacterium]
MRTQPGYEHYRPAYRFGWESRREAGEAGFSDVEEQLRERWGNEPSDMSWEAARLPHGSRNSGLARSRATPTFRGMPRPTSTRATLAGYGFALTAGALWGTTGPLSTALYDQGVEVTDVGFWRVLLATLGFLLYGAYRRDLFRIDRKGLLLVAGGGGLIVAVFEVAYQFAIAGIGVAGAATLLYLAPMMVAVLARPLLGEALTTARVALAFLVLVGVTLTVTGHTGEGTGLPGVFSQGWVVGVTGGVLSATAYASSTLLARWAVPRYGSIRTLFLELLGGTLVLGLLLPVLDRAPAPPGSLAGWTLVVGLGLGSVFAANLCFFAAVKRIEAAPTAVAASIEPVVGALLALALFGQDLTALGWIGLLVVVAGVAISYAREKDGDDVVLPDAAG